MSKFPPDMQLWPEGTARSINVDNRFEGEINGVPYRCEIKGDFAAISYIDQDGKQHRVFQPHFSALGLLMAGYQVGHPEDPTPSSFVELKPKPDGD